MTDDSRSEPLCTAAADYNRPPPVPREKIWRRISAARQQAAGVLAPPGPRDSGRVESRNGRRTALRAGVVLGSSNRGRTGVPPRSRVLAGLVAAASIVLAVGLGQVLLDTAPPGSVTTGAMHGATHGAAGSTLPFALAAVEHLGEAEMMLEFFRAEARTGGPDPATVDWARELVSTTRLIMDSPAAEDPALHDLLLDLELVLVQIAQTGNQDHSHVELIEQGIEEGNVLLRLAAASPEHVAAGLP